jgi:hypothetical protein
VCPSLARIADRRACLRSPNPLAEWRTWKRCLARGAHPPTRKGARLDPGHAPAPGRLVWAGGARWRAPLGLVRQVGAPRNRVGSARPQRRPAIGGDPRALQQRPGRLVVVPGRRPGPRLQGGLQLVMAHHEEEDTPRGSIAVDARGGPSIRNADNSASPLLVSQRTRRFHERVAACPSGSSATPNRKEEHHQMSRFVSWLPIAVTDPHARP